MTHSDNAIGEDEYETVDVAPIPVILAEQEQLAPACKTVCSISPLTGTEAYPTQVFPRNRKRHKGQLVHDSSVPLLIGTREQVLAAFRNGFAGPAWPTTTVLTYESEHELFVMAQSGHAANVTVVDELYR